MTEGAIEPGIEDYPKSELEYTTGEKTISDEESRQTTSIFSLPKIIWTPRFIVIFTLTLITGLCVASLLTRGWITRIYTGHWVFQVYVILICLGWFALLALAHSSWVRIGSIFGCIWALFLTLNIIVNTQQSDLASHIFALANAATCIALLGSYICLSIENIPFSRLDAWFFGLAPIAGSIAVALVYFLNPVNEQILNVLVTIIATIALVLSILVWWMRPNCWKSQPGPTFLLGCVPLIFLILTISNTPFNPSNYFFAQVLIHPNSNLITNESNFFLSQVALLCLFLGIIRVLQYERVTTAKK